MRHDVLERGSSQLVTPIGGLAAKAIDGLEEQALAPPPEIIGRRRLDHLRSRNGLPEMHPFIGIETCFGQQRLVTQPCEQSLVGPARMCSGMWRDDGKV